MAKNIVQQKTKTAVASRSDPSVPDYLANEGGVGLSDDARDNIIPRVVILQPLSPQVLKKNPAYIPGAEAGDIWLKGAGENPIVKGEEGIYFTPCAFWKSHTEWRPREEGGGLVRIYENNPADDTPLDLPDDAEKEEGGFNFVRPNGNVIIFNRSYAGCVFDRGAAPLPHVMIFSSTGLTFARQWMTIMNTTLIHPKTGHRLPIWSRKWHLKTVHKQNNQGEWFLFGEPKVDDWMSKEEAEMLKNLNIAFSKGQKQAAYERDDEATKGGGRSNEM